MPEERKQFISKELRWISFLLFAGVATTAPLLYLLLIMFKYPLLVPYLDQWEFIPVLQKSYEGTLGLVDLWGQHNEHRLIFPRFAMLLLAHLTQWNIAYELAVNLVLGLGLFLVFLLQFRTTANSTEPGYLLVAVSLLASFVFSVSQWQNWFFGWQLQEFMNVLAVVSSLLLLAHRRLEWKKLAGAIVLAFVATYSFANGLCVWPIGLVGIILTSVETRQRRVLYSAIWCVAGVAATGSYLYGYEKPAYHPDTALAFSTPLNFIVYVLAYLGAPIVDYNVPVAIVFGAFGVITTIGFMFLLSNHLRVETRFLLPYLLVSMYALASAGATAIGRLGFGPEQATSSRYITFAQLLWIALLGLSLPMLKMLVPRLGAWFRWSAAALAVLLLAALSTNSLYGTLKWTERQRFRSEAISELKGGNDPGLLQRLHPNAALILERREILRKLRLSVFRNMP